MPADDRFAAAAPLRALLEQIAERLGIAAIDELRIFPPRRFERGESRVLVVSVFTDDRDRRRVFTAHYTARTDHKGRVDVQSAIAEQAVAPADRVGPVVDGVLRRLDDETVRTPPETLAIRGDRGRWDELLASLAASDDDDGRAPGTPPGVANPRPVHYQ